VKELSDFELQNKSIQILGKSNAGHVRLVAKDALRQILEPLAGFVLDSGLSTGEFCNLFREAAVRSAASKQLNTSDRVNISGIAATTGIPRAEISRILKSKIPTRESKKSKEQQSTNRILAGWYADPKFTTAGGQPSDLKLYGRSATFDALARKYGRGLPTRALLDELLRAGAIELLPNQKVRAKAPVAIERGVNAQMISTYGERASDLLSTLLINMRGSDVPRFVANISDSLVQKEVLPLFRKELASKSADLLADFQESLSRKRPARVSKSPKNKLVRISVTIFCNEFSQKGNRRNLSIKRRNFRRAN
jgi:hypothetical protein